MNEPIYHDLAVHIGPLPMVKELFEILELLFTPEQAEYATHLPIARTGEITVEDVAGKTGKGIEEVTRVLETMAREGKLQALRNRNIGKQTYALFPLVPGIMESTFADGIENEEREKLTKIWNKYFEENLAQSLGISNYPLFRIIPINQNLDPAHQVLPFEDASKILENTDYITVIPCLCRSVAKKCNHIMEADMVLGDWAEYLINYRGARRWSSEEALKRLRECEEDGLVHLTANSRENTLVICNCCTCCCGALRGVVELNSPRIVSPTNYQPEVNQEECILCLRCQEICPTKVIAGVPGATAEGMGEKIRLKESGCIGCGLCSTHCPVNAIRMVKVRDNVPARTRAEMEERFVKEIGPVPHGTA